MKTLLLPGVNPATVDWLHLLREKLALADSDTTLNSYRFWSDPDGSKNLSREIANLPADEFDLIIGKSLGTLILLQALYQKKIACRQALLIGMPLANIGTKPDFQPTCLELLENDNIFVVQQRHDKFGPVELVTRYSPANLLVIEGDDHLYDVFDLYVADVRQWLDIPPD